MKYKCKTNKVSRSGFFSNGVVTCLAVFSIFVIVELLVELFGGIYHVHDTAVEQYDRNLI